MKKLALIACGLIATTMLWAKTVYEESQWHGVCLLSGEQGTGTVTSFDWEISGDDEKGVTLSCWHYNQNGSPNDKRLKETRLATPAKEHKLETSWDTAQEIIKKAKDTESEIIISHSQEYLEKYKKEGKPANVTAKFITSHWVGLRLWPMEDETALYAVERYNRGDIGDVTPADMWLEKYVNTKYIKKRSHMKKKIMKAYDMSEAEAEKALDKYGYYDD